MKKKISLILLCGIVLLGVCGCDNKPKNDTKPKEEKFTELKNLGSIGKYDVKCDEIKDIVDYLFYPGLFITNDGKLYQLSFDKVFSNEKNCKQVESNNTFKKFIRSGILDNQNNIYYFDKDKYELEIYNFEPGYTSMPYIKDIDKSNYLNISSAKKPNDSMIDLYFYTKENKVYRYDADNNFRLTLNNEPIFVLENDEVIEYSLDETIKTNKNFYVYSSKVKNKEECEKYADIKCIYEDSFYKVDKNISNQYENIKFYKTVNGYGTIIVDINNNVYTNSFGG